MPGSSRRLRRRRLSVIAGLALILGGSGLTGCGLHQARTALAIQSATYDNGTTTFQVECATDVKVTYGRDHGGSDLPEVTVWGRPKVGRCHPVKGGSGDLSAPAFVDGATGQVVHVRLAPGSSFAP